MEQVKENQTDYMILKNSFNEIEKRCVKHQKNEIEVKKQITVYKEFIVSNYLHSRDYNFDFIFQYKIIIVRINDEKIFFILKERRLLGIKIPFIALEKKLLKFKVENFDFSSG